MTIDTSAPHAIADQSGPQAATVPVTMRAITQDRYGETDVLSLATVPVPTPGPGQVLVKVRAAGVDRGTWHLMAGLPRLLRLGFGLRRPKQPVPGLDLAGRVVAVGPSVTRFSVGDEVMGIGRGTFAAFAVAPEAKLVARPTGLSPHLAAAATISGITALQAVRDAGRVGPGQSVLVLGASGGVGSFAVQIACSLGAHVTGVASAAKADLVRSLGAEGVIDYTTTDPLAGGDRYDVIIDLAGRRRVSALRRCLTAKGTLVIAGGEGGGTWTGGFGRGIRAAMLSPFTSQRLVNLLSRERQEHIADLADLLDRGVVTPAVERTYPLAEAPAALRDLAAGRVRGKVVLTIDDGA